MGILDNLGLLALQAWCLGIIYGVMAASACLNMARKTHAEQQAVCALLAIHTGEPALTACWIVFCFVTGLGISPAGDAVSSAFVLTAPMMILLTPAVALGWNDGRSRDWAVGTLGLGILRWIISVGLTISLNTTTSVSTGLGVNGIVAMLGVVLLWFCVFRVKRILDEQYVLLNSQTNGR